jgi:hypothetical protein
MGNYRRRPIYAISGLLVALVGAIESEVVSSALQWISEKVGVGHGGKMTAPFLVIAGALAGYNFRTFTEERKTPIEKLRSFLRFKIRQGRRLKASKDGSFSKKLEDGVYIPTGKYIEWIEQVNFVLLTAFHSERLFDFQIGKINYRSLFPSSNTKEQLKRDLDSLKMILEWNKSINLLDTFNPEILMEYEEL